MSDVEITRTYIRPIPNQPDTKTVMIELRKKDDKTGKIKKKKFRLKQNFAHENAQDELKKQITAVVKSFQDDNSPENILENAIDCAIDEMK
jgi:hypothetical protein